MTHESVLLHESIDGLSLTDGDVVIDATLGNGGHTLAILGLHKDITVVGIDLDEDAIARSKQRIGNDSRVIYINDSYRNLERIMQDLDLTPTKILFDFGFSSNQIEESGRGFSFKRDEPLLMTFKTNPGGDDLTAFEIVNHWEEDTIRTILKLYGEEKFAGRIAKKIIEVRESKPIESTFDLVDVILSATPVSYHKKKIHPATKTFQALRITTNDELSAVTDGIETAFRLLSSKGRIAAISFHSHEDRIVKHTFRAWSQVGVGTLITKKPITPSKGEIEQNPRSRSAKLRIIEKN